MRNVKKLFLLLLMLVFTIFCSGCFAGPKLNNALEEINHSSYTLKMETFQYWESKYGLCEKIGSQETIIYQDENQAYSETNIYNSYSQNIKTEYQYLEVVDENIFIYNNNSGAWAMDKKMTIEQYISTNPSMTSFKSKPSELFKYEGEYYKGDTELLKDELRFFLKRLYEESGFYGKLICDIIEYSITLEDDSIKSIYLELSFYPQGHSGGRYDFNIHMEFSNIGKTTVEKPLEIK